LIIVVVFIEPKIRGKLAAMAIQSVTVDIPRSSLIKPEYPSNQ